MYRIHCRFNHLHIIKAQRTMHNPLRSRPNTLRAFNRRLRVLVACPCRQKQPNIHHTSPNQPHTPPYTHQKTQNKTTLPRNRLSPLWHGWERIGLGGFPSASQKQRYERDAIAERMMDSENCSGLSFCSRDVEDV